MVHRAIELDGTCSGEHGVGLGKVEYLESELGQGTVGLMESLKRTSKSPKAKAGGLSRGHEKTGVERPRRGQEKPGLEGPRRGYKRSEVELRTREAGAGRSEARRGYKKGEGRRFEPRTREAGAGRSEARIHKRGWRGSKGVREIS